MNRRIVRYGAGALVLLVALASCGRLRSGPGGQPSSPASPSGISHPTGAGDLVLRIDQQGGFVPPSVLLSRFPPFSLFGDGTIVVEGPIPEIDPGPVLPNLQARTVDEAGIQRILEAARDAGLLGPDRAWTTMTASDLPTTVFTVNAGGERHAGSVYGLGEQPNAEMSDQERDARTALSKFQDVVSGLDTFLPAGSLGPERPFQAAAVRLFVSDYQPSQDPNLQQEPVQWPLAGSLADFGHPSQDRQGARCGVVDGLDAQTLLADAQRANQLTPWVSNGARFSLLFRPLLPDETGCPGLS